MRKLYNKVKHTVLHKISFWKWGNIVKKFKEYGLPLLVIFIIWEIIEDVIFPYIAYLLGNNVHEGFYAFIPVAWICCLHPFVVPIIFWAYLKVKKN